MLIQIISYTGFQGQTQIESNTLTQESLTEVLNSLEINPGSNSVVSYSYKAGGNRQTGDFTGNTTINSEAVLLTIQMKETKARGYSAEEVTEIVEEAKEAIKNQEYKTLRSSCRDLSQVSAEVKEAVGNYTHYSVSSLISAIERALLILAPATTEVDNAQLGLILDKITLLEAKVEKIATETSTGNVIIEFTEELNKIKANVQTLADHLGLVMDLPTV